MSGWLPKLEDEMLVEGADSHISTTITHQLPQPSMVFYQA